VERGDGLRESVTTAPSPAASRQNYCSFAYSALARNAALQRLAVEEFHHKRDAPVLLADFAYGANVGMIQCGSDASLPPEAFEELGSWARSSGRNFNATERQSSVSSALYTTPIPPPPSFPTTR
jgi:hypothetical protein